MFFRVMPRFVCAVAVAWYVWADCSCGAELWPAPDQPGPFGVGVQTRSFVDEARTDNWTRGPRSLLTDIWYPVDKDVSESATRDFVGTYLPNIPEPAFELLKGMAQVDLASLFARVPCVARRDAAIRPGKYPLILFSHGNGAARFQSIFLCEHLASHGYVVVAPDHTGNSFVTFVDGRIVLYNEEGREQAAMDRPKDISFLIDCMDKLSADTDSPFHERIDLERIGVTGHSFGGYTCVEAADADPRVDAIVPMAGLTLGERVNYTCPVMVLRAENDRLLGKERNDTMRTYYEQSKGPRYWVEFKRGNHYSFSEVPRLDVPAEDLTGLLGDAMSMSATDIPADVLFPLVNGYTTAFFGLYVKGLEAYDAYLDVNHNPEELNVEHAVPALE